MTPPQTVKALTAAIWDLETELDLLHKPLGGVKVWQLLRMEIYYALAKGLGINDDLTFLIYCGNTYISLNNSFGSMNLC